MIPKHLCSTSSYLTFRSALFADNATKAPIQNLIQNALGTARQLFRGLFQNKLELPAEIIRKQHRLPVEYCKGGPEYIPKSNFYRPGVIHKVTSNWYTNSFPKFQRNHIVKRFYRGGSGPLLGFVGFALAKKPSLLTEDEELEGVSYLIRDSFASVAYGGQNLNIDKNSCLVNVSLENLKIGELIAKGCNAAIYSASLHENNAVTVPEDGKVKPSNVSDTETAQVDTDSKFFIKPEKEIDVVNLESDKNFKYLDQKTKLQEITEKISETYNSQFFVPHSEGENKAVNNGCRNNVEPEKFGMFDKAVKVMFNYDAESNAFAIWNAMYKETLPSVAEFTFGDTWKHKVKRKKLKPHPNIVKMYSAFADYLPLLPGAVENYPSALPTRLLNDGCGRNMTLFLIMERYHCCLKDYLKCYTITPETALLLFTQLLEALVHLAQNNVAHRDLKSDNILIDLSEGILCPKLAITDFGCCLENLSLRYPSDDVSKGGNMSLTAPEVINAEAGPNSIIDYSRADLWSAGSIAYEIFGHPNPFYSKLKNFSYAENDLPPLSNKAPPPIQNLIRDILHVNPKQRPSPSLAATICQVLLHAPSSLLEGPFNNKSSKKALKWMFEHSAQTYFEVQLLKREPLPVKLELSRTLCCRIQYLELIEALEYIWRE